jgi:hypothetical protein
MRKGEELGEPLHNHGKPGDFYRQLVLGLIPEQQQEALEGADFAELLDSALEEIRDDPVPSIGRYIVATGLLACGRSEMVEVVLDNVPHEDVERGRVGKVHYLGVNALRALLPLPQALQGDGGWYSFPDLGGVRRWWLKRRHALHWDLEHDRYVLEMGVPSETSEDNPRLDLGSD